METIEEGIKELNELYAKATTKEDYHQIWMLARKLDQETGKQGVPRVLQLKGALNGLWARYYEAKKFDISPGDVNDLYESVKRGVDWADSENDVELAINYRYLLSVVVGQLMNKPEEAAKIDEEMQRLVKDTNNVPLALRVINARGLNAIQKKDWSEAIAIFTTAEQGFPEAPNIPEARQHLGNTVNNRGLSKLNLSDEVQDPGQKKEMVRSAVWDLLVAMNLYFMTPLIPLKHLEGIRNRLWLARDKAKEIDPDLVKAIEIFVQ